MKVLLICLILTIGCHSNEESNANSTSPIELTVQFESLKLVNETTTATVSNFNVTTERIEDFRNETTTEPIAFKKKPNLKATKHKKIYKPSHLSNFYKIHEDNIDLNIEESKSIRKNPYIINSRSGHNWHRETIDPRKNSSIKYKSFNEFKKEESRVMNNYVKPDASSQRSRSRHYSQIDRSRPQNSQKFNRNNSGDVRNTEESRRNENYIQYSYKYKPDLQHTRTVPDEHQLESQDELSPGGRPSLPEIQNVIHTLDSQDSQPSYKSPKQNHIVEVTEVPLVFEHHYQGDYKNPQANFVAHQYSYSPPADTTDEAYRLGKILSQNVVQKLETSQEPLREYVQDQQEVILAGYTHGVPTYSYVNVNLNPLRTSLENPQSVHPILKYLASEMTPQSFSQDIQHFQTAQLNPFQLISPQTPMQPIVVEDEEPRSEYGTTTYLHSVSGSHQNNNNEQAQTQTNSGSGHTYHQNQNQHTHSDQSAVSKSPYSVNVQQHYVNVPKYTVGKFKQNKPQAIHEVEPPNLSGLANDNNYNSIRYHIPSAIPTPSADLLRNTLYSGSQIEHERPSQQEEQVENPNSNFRLEGVIPSTKMVQYVIPQQSPNTPTLVHRPRTQMIPSRPYWRKPQVMKLVRVPERNKYQQEEQIHQTHYQSYRNPGEDSRIRNQQLYQSLAEHYSSPVNNHQVSVNQEQHDEYSGNIMRLLPQQITQQHEITQLFSEKPIVVEEVYNTNQNQAEEQTANIYAQSAYANQVADENLIRHQNFDEQSYQNERPDMNSNGNVEIVKSISQYYPQQQDENTRENNMYGKPMVEEDAHTSSELPKGYLSFQQQRNHPRSPQMVRVENTRHIMPLARFRNRENYDSRTRIMNPRIRRLVTDLLKDSNRRKNFYVVMTEEE